MNLAGFREFAPGQVWFYYNPNATKALEQKKELGSCTSRPVVIIQKAFYPEWNDMVTVCPMTSSDRRSGVYIDTTILKDGSFIEGGTIIPYLFYNIRTKYLYPVIASNHKRKLITLADEDFEKVKHGFQYHFGLREDPPDYVVNWKHLNDFERNIVVQDLRLAIHDWEETLLEHKGTMTASSKKGKTNPVLRQNPASSSSVENHILANVSNYSKELGVFYSDEESFNAKKLNEVTNASSDTKEKPTKPSITFEQMDVQQFAFRLEDKVGGIFPTAYDSNLYSGSNILNGVSLKDMADVMSFSDKLKILNMTISDIMDKTGIQSASTASRFRKELRSANWGDTIIYDAENNVMEFLQNDSPENFEYHGDFITTKSRIRKNARRRKALFQYSYEEISKLIQENPSNFADAMGLPSSYDRAVRDDIKLLYPKLEELPEPTDEPKSTYDIFTDSQSNITESLSAEIEESASRYPFWSSLSVGEMMEFKCTAKKYMSNLCRNYGIDKKKANAVKGYLQSIMNSKKYKMPIPNAPLKEENACTLIISGEYSKLTREDLMIFCQTNSDDISRYYNQLKLPNTPSKADIRKLKCMIRAIITDVND